jgi:hypothetical protein
MKMMMMMMMMVMMIMMIMMVMMMMMMMKVGAEGEVVVGYGREEGQWVDHQVYACARVCMCE